MDDRTNSILKLRNHLPTAVVRGWVRREENQPTVRMSMLEDSHSSHKTKRVAMLCKTLNVQLAIISGGLTGDAQLGDRVFIKRFKRVHRRKLLEVMRTKW